MIIVYSKPVHLKGVQKEVTKMTRILDLIPSVGYTPWTRRSLFEPFFPVMSRPHFYVEEGAEWMPPSEITESEKEYIVTLEIPGVDMQGLDISFTDGVLTIKGEKKRETVEDECCHCSERYSGSFERSFQIPGKVKGDEIDATYKDGILRVVLSKSEESQVRKIEVKH
jgi:HSP20 family protein